MTHSPPPGTPRARIPGPQQPPPPYPRIAAGLWKRCLGGGLGLWALTAAAMYATSDAALLPTLILLGGFLAPVAFVLWAYERHGRDLGVSAVLGCFLAGGALGVLGTASAEPYPPHSSLAILLGVGLVEEAAKLGALVFVLRRQPGISGTRAGLVLGAALGFGFAALESTGSAFDAAFSEGVGLRALLETQLLRGLLAPAGQALWTAITGGMLLSLRRPNGRFRYAPPLVAACMGAALLHALWDATHGVALRLAERLASTAPGARPGAPGYPSGPSAVQQHLFTLFSIGGAALVGLAGVAWVLSLLSLTRRNTSWRRNTP
ncbi:PrsW family intramembrane metalloprotease [Streptomyces sp. AF1A]|uniref:PrsW family intramembrane metalloprotease n=1 Tax=Streptomyces sp. AF1A TaxID=3394350 RepID=UPI0039BD79BD